MAKKIQDTNKLIRQGMGPEACDILNHNLSPSSKLSSQQRCKNLFTFVKNGGDCDAEFPSKNSQWNKTCKLIQKVQPKQKAEKKPKQKAEKKPPTVYNTASLNQEANAVDYYRKVKTLNDCKKFNGMQRVNCMTFAKNQGIGASIFNNLDELKEKRSQLDDEKQIDSIHPLLSKYECTPDWARKTSPKDILLTCGTEKIRAQTKCLNLPTVKAQNECLELNLAYRISKKGTKSKGFDCFNQFRSEFKKSNFESQPNRKAKYQGKTRPSWEQMKPIAFNGKKKLSGECNIKAIIDLVKES